MLYKATEANYNTIFHKDLIFKDPASSTTCKVRYYRGLIALIFKWLGIAKTIENSDHKVYTVNRKQFERFKQIVVPNQKLINRPFAVKNVKSKTSTPPPVTASTPPPTLVTTSSPAPSPSPTSKPKELTDKDLKKLEFESSKFWKTFYSTKGHFSEKFTNSARELYSKDIAGFETTIDHLIEKYHHSYPIDAVDNEELSKIKEFLKKEIQLQFEKVFIDENRSPDVVGTDDIAPKLKKTISIEGNKTVKVLSTVGDGSCGLHALLGKPDGKGQIACPNIADIRNQFADWLAAYRKFESKEEMNFIKIVTDDFFLNYSTVPRGVKTAEVEKLYKEKKKEFDALEGQVQEVNAKMKQESDQEKKQVLQKQLQELYKQKDKINLEFRDSDIVFKAYQNHLRNTGTYLLQEELIAAAKFFKKNLVICQPGWGSDPIAGTLEFKFGNPADAPSYVWYNGFNHYEQAVLDIPSEEKAL